jgi:hypothetical protein
LRLAEADVHDVMDIHGPFEIITRLWYRILFKDRLKMLPARQTWDYIQVTFHELHEGLVV